PSARSVRSTSIPSRGGSIQSSNTASKLSRLSRQNPSSPVFAVTGSKPSPFSPLASARAVLASSSISKTLTSETVKLPPHRAKGRDSEENFRSARFGVFVNLAQHDPVACEKDIPERGRFLHIGAVLRHK